MKSFVLLSLIIISMNASAQKKEPLEADSLKQRIERIEYSLEQIQRDKLNYQIEKDLLKETYSRNYETLNIVLTIILGIFGILSFFGLKDISTIKKEYNNELNSLKDTKLEFDLKTKELEHEKSNFEKDIKHIFETNENQNRKIKILELKEKIAKFIEDEKHFDALEYINIALDLMPDDTSLLTSQGIVYTRLFRLDKAIQSFKKAYEVDPTNEGLLGNLIEIYSLSNNFKEAEDLIGKNKMIYENRGSGGLKIVKEIFELFYKNDDNGLKKYIESTIDKTDLEIQKSRYPGWRFTEALYVAVNQKESKLMGKLVHLLWYLNGQINGKTLIEKLNLLN